MFLLKVKLILIVMAIAMAMVMSIVMGMAIQGVPMAMPCYLPIYGGSTQHMGIAVVLALVIALVHGAGTMQSVTTCRGNRRQGGPWVGLGALGRVMGSG